MLDRFPGEFIKLRWSPEAVTALDIADHPHLIASLLQWQYLRNPAFSPVT